MGFLFGSHHQGYHPGTYHQHYQQYGHHPGYGLPHQGFDNLGGPSQGHQVPYPYQGFQPIYNPGHYPSHHPQGHSSDPYPYNQAQHSPQQNPHLNYQQYHPYQQTPFPYQPFIYDESQGMVRENEINQEDSY